MLFKEDYIWDNDKTVCTCILTLDGQDFTGVAKCHSVDRDMSNRIVGETLSFNRAYIKILRYLRKIEVEIPLTHLTNLFKNMQTSYRFNGDSFEAKQIKKEIKRLQDAKEVINEQIEIIKQYNKDYINAKDNYYKKVRASREKEKAVSN